MTTLSAATGTAEVPALSSARTATSSRALPWAALGAAFLAFQIYLYTSWIAGGDAHQNTFGRSQAPTWMFAAMWTHVALGTIALVVVVRHFIVVPWRREHRLTGDGLLLLACLTCFWGDLGANYLHYSVVYPTVWPNLGSWYNHIPGWHGSAGNLQAEATVFFFSTYATVMFGFTSFAMAVMRRARARWSSIGRVPLFLIAWLVLGGFDLVLEVPWVHLGIFVYPSTISWLTLFSGHYYQFPIYESLIWGACWAGLACLRFYRDDRGLTAVERGADRVARSPKRQTLVRFLALVAAANICLLTYNVTFGLIAAKSGRWVDDVTTRPYMTDGFCAAGVTYACPPAATSK